jgi:hypothetical protein
MLSFKIKLYLIVCYIASIDLLCSINLFQQYGLNKPMFGRFIPVSPISCFAYNFPVSPIPVLPISCFAYFLFCLFHHSPISCFAYFHVRSRLSQWGTIQLKCQVWGTASGMGYGVFMGARKGESLNTSTAL